MKLALGLFHFNLLYVAGNVSGYHRYCTEAIIPFLRTAADTKWFRSSFEITGVGLDFLAKHYPAALDLLRRLVASGQLELISSTYYPTAWILFPRRDLLESIELNRQCLARLNLTASPVFFSQECFFGRGLSRIADRFPIVLCKDDYLLPQIPSVERKPVYHMNGVKVVVGSNHLANRSASRQTRQEVDAEKGGASAHVLQRNLQISSGNSGFETGTLSDVEWKWYHFGSGHHFAAPAPPTDPERFFFDPHWMAANLSYLASLRDEGYTFSTITNFAERIPDRDVTPLPFVVEGGWNIRRSKGVYQWMGGAPTPWQNSPSILATVGRSRERLLSCEAMVRRMALDDSSDYARRTRELWTKQVMAECSDPHGWLPTQSEVQFGQASAEDALTTASHLLAELSFASNLAPPRHFPPSAEAPASLDLKVAPLGLGETTIRRLSEKLHLVETKAEPKDGLVGVVFQRANQEVTYCCSGMEDQATTFRLEDIAMPEVYLPLTNGLISLGDDRFLIRVNAYGVTAAKLSQRDNTVVFQAATPNRALRQRFLVYDGALEDAVNLANSVNVTGEHRSEVRGEVGTGVRVSAAAASHEIAVV